MELTHKISNVIHNHVRKIHVFIVIVLVLWISMILFLNDEAGPKPQPYVLINETVDYIAAVNYDGNESFLYDSNQISQYVQLPPDNVHGFQVILFWTPYFGEDIMKTMKQSLENDNIRWLLFRPKNCFGKYPKCLFTSDRSYRKSARALIFHWRDLSVTDLPERNANQSWVLYNLEAPPNTAKLYEGDPTLTFNWTATYRRDSDIPVLYGTVMKRRKPVQIDFTKEIDLRDKTKPVVWFVSNCRTQSRREIYATELSRYLQVDVYGKCGKYTCSRTQQDECYRKAARKYLFYLSFENSVCKDYVTEKLFNVMQYDIVPIVYGGADYPTLLPPGSYIDATHMKPKELAQLLIKIAGDRAKYLSYFQWRKWYFIPAKQIDDDLYCQICKKIARQESEDENRKIHKKQLGRSFMTWTEINRWFFDDACREINF